MRLCLLPVAAALFVSVLFGVASVGAQENAGFANQDAVGQLVAEIDRIIAEGWEAEATLPSPPADDAEFMRRLYLDVTGRIPPVADVRDFLADTDPHKRRKLVDRLLDGPTYVIHNTNLWRAAMLPEADADAQIRFFLPGFESWLRSRLAENRNYAEIAEEVLTLDLAGQDVRGFNQQDRPTPSAFYTAKEGKPENLAAATSRIFLGVRIECAQCHDHPFDSWKQREFWGYAAFFAEFAEIVPGTPVEAVQNLLMPDKRSLKIPETEEVVPATFLGGEVPDWTDRPGTRKVLAKWVTSPENPWFAKAAVNRMWAHYFGMGIVDPLDDFGPNNPPSHPELLDVLAPAFVASGYDFKFMTRAITSSRAYQLSSAVADVGRISNPSAVAVSGAETDGLEIRPTAARTFSRMPVRAMTPEQIFDSLAIATGYQQPFNPEEPINFNNDQVRQEFLETFKNEADAPTERSSTILQALTLMNGRFVSDATDLADSQTLAAILNAPFLDTDGKIEAMFLATVTRKPHAGELEQFRTYVETGGPKQDKQAALSDVFWALLNSSEFLLNH
jgi:hypothetical protein